MRAFGTKQELNTPTQASMVLDTEQCEQHSLISHQVLPRSV